MDVLQPEGWKRPRGYANGVRVPAGQELILVAGMVGWNEREEIVSDDFVAQFEQALRNVLAVLERAGAGAQHVIRMTVYVTDLDAYRSRQADLGAAWKRQMGGQYPAMTLVGVAGLLEEGARVELEVTAAVPSPR